MPAQWTKQARAELSPRRGDAVKVPSLAYDANELADSVKRVLAERRPEFDRGKEHADAVKEHLALTASIFELETSCAPDRAPRDASFEGALVTVITGWGTHHATVVFDLARHWIAQRGLAFAVEALGEASAWMTAHPSGSMNVSWLRKAYAWGIAPMKLSPLRDELERAILGARDDAYADVAAKVTELCARWPEAACDMVALVPTEHALAAKVLTATIDRVEAKKKNFEMLYAETKVFNALADLDVGERLLRLIVARRLPHHIGSHIYDAVRLLEDRAIPPLVEVVTAWVDDPPKPNMGLADARKVARALALFEDERVANAFAPWVGDAKCLGPVAVEYFTRFGALATATLAPRLLEKNKKGDAARDLLARIGRTDAGAMRAAAAALSAPQRAAAEKLAAPANAASKGEAAMSDLPRVLASPPWRTKGARAALPVLATPFAPLPYAERIRWKDDEERVHWRDNQWSHRVLLMLTPAELKELEAKLAEAVRAHDRNVNSWMRPRCPWRQLDDVAALRLWTDVPAWARQGGEGSMFSESRYMLARFELAAIPGACASVLSNMYEESFDTLLRCDSPRIAHVVLRGLGKGALRRAAEGWIAKHAEAAAIGLLPIALGPSSREKLEAGSALRVMASKHGDAKILEVAGRWGDAVAEAARAALSFDPLFECPKAPPKLAAFADPASLPPIALKDGRRVPTEGLRNLLEMLQFTPLSPPYAGVAAVAGAFDARSIDELLRALSDAWVAAGAASASAWALRASAHVGGDAAARDLAAKIRRWPREKGRARALVGVEVLGRMNNDVALMHLADLSKTAKNKHVEALAKEVLATAATARGLDEESLADRLVPTLDLDADGSTTLDFGPRAFTLRVDEHLTAQLFDGGARPGSGSASGPLLKAIPRPNKNDDAAKAKEASARYKGIKADLETVGKTLLLRLENAMIGGRRWTASEHATLLVGHPLTGRVARRLVWGVVEGDGPGSASASGASRGRVVATFRVAEDGSLADHEDKALTLADDARVGIPHPLDLDASTLAAWGTLLADYALLQPFEQVGRAIAAATKAEQKAKTLSRFHRPELPYGVLFGRLEARGWRRSNPDDGYITDITKTFGRSEATLSFMPPIYMREKPPERVSITDVGFGVPFGDVGAIAFSELVYDLAPLEGKK